MERVKTSSYYIKPAEWLSNFNISDFMNYLHTIYGVKYPENAALPEHFATYIGTSIGM